MISGEVTSRGEAAGAAATVDVAEALTLVPTLVAGEGFATVGLDTALVDGPSGRGVESVSPSARKWGTIRAGREAQADSMVSNRLSVQGTKESKRVFNCKEETGARAATRDRKMIRVLLNHMTL